MSQLPNNSAAVNGDNADVPLPVRAISALDLLLCMANVGLCVWTVYKLYIEKDIDFVGYSMFANMVIVTSGAIGLFGILANVLIQGGMGAGARFGWWRIASALGSVAVALGLMYMLLPNPDQLLSVRNRNTYLIFGGSSLARVVWVAIYGFGLVWFSRAVSRSAR